MSNRESNADIFSSPSSVVVCDAVDDTIPERDQRDDLVFLRHVSNRMEADMLRDLLFQEGIPTLLQDGEEIGNCLRIVMGYSIYGESIYVRKSDFARASECLSALSAYDGMPFPEEAVLIEKAEQSDMEQEDGKKSARAPEDSENGA